MISLEIDPKHYIRQEQQEKCSFDKNSKIDSARQKKLSDWADRSVRFEVRRFVKTIDQRYIDRLMDYLESLGQCHEYELMDVCDLPKSVKSEFMTTPEARGSSGTFDWIVVYEEEDSYRGVFYVFMKKRVPVVDHSGNVMPAERFIPESYNIPSSGADYSYPDNKKKSISKGNGS